MELLDGKAGPQTPDDVDIFLERRLRGPEGVWEFPLQASQASRL